MAHLLFEGIPAAELAAATEGYRRLHFPAGSVLIEEGSTLDAMFLIVIGVADIILTDARGEARHLRRVGPGETVGEISLVTGQPATATVRAATDIEAQAVTEEEFAALAAAFPRVYQNLTSILSERLVRANRRSLGGGPGRASILLDWGASPLLAYALACSVAWHARQPTLLLVLDERPLPEPLATIARREVPGPFAGDDRPREARAHLMAQAPTGAFGGESLSRTMGELCDRYAHVLVLVSGEAPPPPFEPWLYRGGVPPSPEGGEAKPERVARSLRMAPAGDTRLPPRGAGSEPLYTLRAWDRATGQRTPDPDGVLPIPALEPRDEAALRDGVLPIDSAAGKALGWAARHVGALKVGLALGAGSEKGYGHVGVLRALEAAGIPFDCLAGTSIGAGVAAARAAGHAPDQIAEMMDAIAASMFRPNLPIRSLISNAGLKAELRKRVGEARIETLRPPLAIVAADMLSRREVVFRRGLLWPALLASMAIPGIYPAQRIGEYVLVDGGVLNPVPCNVAAEMGADIVIGVRLQSLPPPRVRDEESQPPSGTPPTVLQVLSRSIEMTQSTIAIQAAAKATLLIEPEFSELGAWGVSHFREGRRYVEEGEAAAREALPRITAALPWLRK